MKTPLHMSRRARRKGVVLMVELIFVFPVVLLITTLVVHFYLLVSAREGVVAGSRLGARIAAAGDKTDKVALETQVKNTVRRSFGSSRLASSTVRIVWSEDLPPEETQGEADWVQVSVEVPTGRVAPNMFGMFGAGYDSQRLVAAATEKVQ